MTDYALPIDDVLDDLKDALISNPSVRHRQVNWLGLLESGHEYS